MLWRRSLYNLNDHYKVELLEVENLLYYEPKLPVVGAEVAEEVEDGVPVLQAKEDKQFFIIVINQGSIFKGFLYVK